MLSSVFKPSGIIELKFFSKRDVWSVIVLQTYHNLQDILFHHGTYTYGEEYQ